MITIRGLSQLSIILNRRNSTHHRTFVMSVLRNQSSSNIKLAANLSMMFVTEKPNITDRYKLAKTAGFNGVECAFLYDAPLTDILHVKSETGLKQVLINSFPGDLKSGELGLAALPNRKEEFKKTLEKSIEYCHALDCQKLHLMAGKMDPNCNWDKVAMELTYIENLKFAAQRLTKEGILGLIEPINKISVPNYFLNNYDDAIKYINEVNSSCLKLQLDVFHLQQISGNLTDNIKKMLPYTGHIQIAQVPFRGEPDTLGEIRYEYIFQLLQELGYNDWIGCEYIPLGNTEAGLKWIQKYNLQL